MSAQAPRGCCLGRAAARRTHDIPAEFRAASARRRQFGGDAGPRGPSRIRRSAPRPGHIGRQAEQGGLASAADRGNPGKKARIVARFRGCFDIEARNRLWVGDITRIETGEGWLYLATVIDAFHRKVVGWSMSGRMTEKPVADALEQAVGRESPPDDFGLVFHDNQGSQHASRALQRCLEPHGIAQSMSRPGNPWDNALAKSLFKTLKRELMNGKGRKTREEAKQDVFKRIELYYRQRMHSSIGYNAPCDLERDIA